MLPETTIQLPKGQDAVFAMKPDQYYIVDQVKLNDETITNQIDANGNLTVKNITADAKLEVSFRIRSFSEKMQKKSIRPEIRSG